MILILVGLSSLVFAGENGTDETLYGNAASKSDTDLNIRDMLTYAIQDEYMARDEYMAIMTKFGTMRPFTNIMEAEKTHISWLRVCRTCPIYIKKIAASRNFYLANSQRSLVYRDFNSPRGTLGC